MSDCREAPMVPLGYVADVRPSGVDKKSKEDEDPILLCNYTDVYYGDRIRYSPEFMEATATEDEIGRFTLRDGDVALTKDSESADDIGVPALVVEDMPGVLLGYHTSLVRPDHTKVDPRYLFWVLQGRPTRSYFEVNSRGVTRFALRTQDVAGTPIPVPGLDEQRRIADMFDHETARIDALIAKNGRLLALVSERRGETVAVGVTENGRSDRVRQVELGWTNRVADADDWSVAPLTAIARTGTGHTPSRSEDDYWQDCTIPWLTTGDVGAFRNGRVESITTTAEMVSELGVQNSSAVVHPAGTVALSRTASVGFSVIMGADMATSQDFFTWTCGPGLLPHYLLYVLRAMKHRGHFDRLMYGSTHKTIYVPDLMGLRTPLPPVSVQHGIVERLQHDLSALDDLSDGMLAQTALLRERREALITAAVTGEIDPATVRSN